MTINRAIIQKMLINAAQVLEENADCLSEIDSRFGDGDHGITIKKIAKLIQERVSSWKNESIPEFLNNLGMATMEVKGGSAGPLYGTMISGLGVLLKEGESELNADGVKRMLQGSLEEMRIITKAKVGDKTMMDALIPAVEAAQKAQGDVLDIWQAAATAAEEGAKASEQYIAMFGRARSYKEQTIGTPDAGALSTALFIRGLADGI